MPTIAGILNVVSGVFGLIAVLGLIIAIVVTGGGLYYIRNIPGLVPSMVPGFVETVLLLITIPLALVSILALVGGICALQRKKWGLALGGSISAILASTPLLGALPVGITATILTALSKDEFE